MIKSTIREKIEQNFTIWFLGTLITGFIAGISVYKGILEIAKLQVISTSNLENKAKRILELETKLEKAKSRINELEKSLNLISGKKESPGQNNKSENKQISKILQNNERSAKANIYSSEKCLQKKSILIYYKESKSESAIKFLEKLKNLGAKIDLKIYRSSSVILDPHIIYYLESSDLEVALSYKDLFYEWKIYNYEKMSYKSSYNFIIVLD